jgi:hypothetical protein
MVVGRGSQGASSLAHAQYICAQAKYRDKHGVLFTESRNLPSWAKAGRDFWEASDSQERANGVRYREWQGALPKELSPPQQIALAREFAEKALGEARAYTLAVHRQERPGRPENPHVHLMWSDREIDGIERPRELFFRRYNGKEPQRGGCRKDAGFQVGRGGKGDRIQELRETWAAVCNKHMERAKVQKQVDMRSYDRQGVAKVPQVHLGPQAHAMELRGIRTDLGDHNREVARANRQLTLAAKYEAMPPEKLMKLHDAMATYASREPYSPEYYLKHPEELDEVRPSGPSLLERCREEASRDAYRVKSSRESLDLCGDYAALARSRNELERASEHARGQKRNRDRDL